MQLLTKNKYLRDAFTEDVFAKIISCDSGSLNHLIGRHPEYFLVSKFQQVDAEIQEFIDDRLVFCYPTIYSVALKYAMNQLVINKFGTAAQGAFVTNEIASFIRTNSSILLHTYAQKSEQLVQQEFDQIPAKYKLNNDALNLNLFNLCHRINTPSQCQLDDNKLAIRIIDLIFNVYSLSYLLSSAEDIFSSSPTPPPSSAGVSHLSKGTFQAKHMVFAAIFRIRSGWDKLMFNLIAEYFSVSFSSKDGYFKKLDKLQAATARAGADNEQFLSLITMAKSIDDLRKLRDNELHNYGVSAQEMFDNHSLVARMDMALYESVRLREATALGLALITSRDETIFARTPYFSFSLSQ